MGYWNKDSVWFCVDLEMSPMRGRFPETCALYLGCRLKEGFKGGLAMERMIKEIGVRDFDAELFKDAQFIMWSEWNASGEPGCILIITADGNAYLLEEDYFLFRNMTCIW